VRISIVTPSYRPSVWLKLCIASVADQQAGVEHIVQDAGSDDGTLDWLPRDTRVKAFVEKDQGMYDGINRGLRRAGGDILAYLNCDEQYLPGALSTVLRFFEEHPAVDVLFGDVVMLWRSRASARAAGLGLEAEGRIHARPSGSAPYQWRAGESGLLSPIARKSRKSLVVCGSVAMG
jgi:glycosyltransferase involved in cell wall biosynthesis